MVSWWTSGSEQRALRVLLDAYKASHADVTVTSGAVAGGAGSNAQIVLAQRLLDGDPPDTWQTFPGGALRAFVDRNQLADVSDLYESGLATAIPDTIREGLTVDGRQYGVPTSAHRGNVLFYNKAMLAKAGVSEPGADYTTATFVDDLAKLDESGVTPLCLGAKDPFTTTALFENTLLSVIGDDGWRRISQDRFDWNSESVDEALRRFGQILDDADPEAAGLTWDAATKKLANGECAFESMNDSAFGELINAGAIEGKTFGQVPYPGYRRDVHRRGRHLRPGAAVGEWPQCPRLPRGSRLPRHSARLQRGQGLGTGPHRRRRVVTDALPAVRRGVAP